jgi:excisionase family DNA binding protein
MKILTVKEVADIVKAKSSTIYAWAEQGVIPCYKINGLLRFSEDEILSWIRQNRAVEKSYNTPVGRRPRERRAG